MGLKEEIEAGYRLSDRQLAERLGCSPTTVGKHRKALINEGKILPKLKVDTPPQACLYEVSTSAILPSPENDQLYDPVRLDCPDFVALCDDMRANGLLQSVVASADGYVISGHRRHAAAKRIGLKTINVMVDPSASREADPDQFVRLLASHNTQRHKTTSESTREQLALMSDTSWQAVYEYRQVASAIPGIESVVLSAPKRRSTITEKLSLRNAIQTVVQENRGYWPLSDRKIFYLLLNVEGLLRNDVKLTPFENSEKCYNDVTNMLTRMRIDGAIPFGCITDETRPVCDWDTHREVGCFMRREFDELFSGYFRDLQQSQPNHIEILAEKNTVAANLRGIAAKYTIPMTSGRGYASIPPRKDMIDRFRASGREKLVIVCVTDFDPEGLDIPISFGASLRDDFGIDPERLVVTRAALNHQQIQTLGLHAGQLAKVDGARYKAFVSQFGERCWELESVPTATLIGIVEDAVRAVLDIPAFERELKTQAEDQQEIEIERIRLRQTLSLN